MTQPPVPPNQPASPSNQPDDPLVVNPINIARARHASAHRPSAVNKVKESKAKKATPSTSTSSVFSILPLQFGGVNGCILFGLLGMAFLAGGFFGGLTGGGLILWANSPQGVAVLAGTATPTPLPSPTPMPVATATATPVPSPVATLSTEDIIGQIIPSVVTVINQQPVQLLGLNPNEGRVVGSGVIVDGRGFIATNHHVIENPGKLSIILANGQTVEAQLVSSDPNQDLAMLRIGVIDLPAIQWGNSTSVRPGQAVYAIGSPLGDFPSSVSFGIISGLSRALEINEHVIDGLIQTDAAINRGSSGGPLVNAKGEVIGINTFIIRESEDRGVAEGIAFAIPATTAQNLLNAWIAGATGQAVPIPAAGEQNN
jgi:S1-C subfamily serine protease